jgi:hypothetical protein
MFGISPITKKPALGSTTLKSFSSTLIMSEVVYDLTLTSSMDKYFSAYLQNGPGVNLVVLTSTFTLTKV